MQVSILGEKLSVVRVDGEDTFSASGRPMAVISNVMVEYRAPRPPRPARRPGRPPPGCARELAPAGRQRFPSRHRPIRHRRQRRDVIRPAWGREHSRCRGRGGSCRSGRAVRAANPPIVARVHRRRGDDARPGHRRQHRHFQRRERRPPSSAAVSGAGSAGARLGQPQRRGRPGTGRGLAWRITCPGASATGRSPAWPALRVDNYNLTGAGNPDKITGARVTGRFFDVLRMQPLLGRTLTERDDQPGAGPVVVIDERVWRARFAADPALPDARFASTGFRTRWSAWCRPTSGFPTRRSRCGCLANSRRPSSSTRSAYFMYVLARLKPNVGLAQAQADMTAVGAATRARVSAHQRAHGGLGLRAARASHPRRAAGDGDPVRRGRRGAPDRGRQPREPVADAWRHPPPGGGGAPGARRHARSRDATAAHRERRARRPRRGVRSGAGRSGPSVPRRV